MKRTILSIVIAGAVFSAQAITLFPFFVDVAGDFEEGTTEKFESLNLPTTKWRVSPYFYSNLKDADDFLKDVLPFSNYVIIGENRQDENTMIVIYTSELEYGGKSTLYLVQTVGEPLYVGFCE